jgi:spermidine/putrescine transport system ATP-binding protein
MIELENIEKYYGDYHALRNITLNIEAGEFFSLLGPSGCGKTTLLRAIAGLEMPSSGRLSIDGVPMQDVPANKRPTNMVFQSYAIFPHLTVAENVAYGLRRQRLGKVKEAQLAAESLETVGLQGFGDRAAHALSGGQRQRVALARALVLKPKVLLLDEPLSALDKKLREAMQSELRHLQRSLGITFVLVTHDQEEALTMSDRVAVMFDGELEQLATPQDLYKRPNSKRVANFFGSMNIMPARILGTEGDTTQVEVAGLGRAALLPDQLPAGGTSGGVCAGVRPELMTILAENAAAPENETRGQVVEVTYVGELTYYDIKLDGLEQPVVISMRNTTERRILADGDMARVGWGAGSIILLQGACTQE